MNANRMTAQESRRHRAACAKFRRDAAALVKFVNTAVRRMSAGKPTAIIVNVVDLRGNNLAALMIKGPPPPPIRFLTSAARSSGAGR